MENQEPQDLFTLYPKCEANVADAHAWVFSDKNTFELYPCKFPELPADHVEVSVLHTGLCMSDVLTGRSSWGPHVRPCCPGHEIIGKVTKIGSAVTTKKVGDIIGTGPFKDCCGTCDICTSGEDHLCFDIDHSKKDLYGDRFGGYCTKLQVKEFHAHAIPDGLDLTTAPPLLCAGVTVYRPLRNHMKKGQKVGILGIGGLGHVGIQYAVALGLEVTAFTRTASKVDDIKALGAHHVVVVDDEFKALKPLSRSLDGILNTIPASSQNLIDSYLGTIKPLGKLLQVGAPNVNTPMSFGFFSIIATEIQIIGSMVGSKKDTQEMLEFSAKHGIKVQAEKFSFEDFPKALDMLENGRPKFRCVVNVEEYVAKHANLQ